MSLGDQTGQAGSNDAPSDSASRSTAGDTQDSVALPSPSEQTQASNARPNSLAEPSSVNAVKAISSLSSPLSVHANAYSPRNASALSKADRRLPSSSGQSQTNLSRSNSGSIVVPGFNGSSPRARPAARSPFNGPEDGDLLTSYTDLASLRRFSHSGLASQYNSTDSRPSFTLHSFSDGVDPLSNPMDAAQTSASYGQSGSVYGASGPPTTGPLSASDPRTQLLVSNLPYRVRWQDLKDLFRKAGTVLRTDVSLSADNRSRGYGTVLMATEQDAIKAAEMLDGFTWQSRTLEVSIDRSGSMGGVAGSAVLSSSNSQPYLNPADADMLHVPTHGSGFHGSTPNSLSGTSPLLGTSPSRASPLAQAIHAPPFAARNSIAGLYDAAISPRPARSTAATHAQIDRTGSPRLASAHLPAHANLGVQSFLSIQDTPRRASDIGILPSSSQLNTRPSSTVQDQLSQPQSTTGSSVPTGFPGATASAPWPAGPGTFAGSGPTQAQSQPFDTQIAGPGVPMTSYAGRVLFVGNLPFHCQWQDLKDLFRAAGTIQRADIAIGPDGRSRGFGTVLFTSQEDAQNAVRLYHGYEYSGRTLKVHFDRFATQQGPAIGTPETPAQYTNAFAAAALPSHMTNNTRSAPYAPQNALPPQSMHVPNHPLPQAPHYQHHYPQQFKSGGMPMGQAAFLQGGQYQHHQQMPFLQQQQPHQGQPLRYVPQQHAQPRSFNGANNTLHHSHPQRPHVNTDFQANRYNTYQPPVGLFREAMAGQETDNDRNDAPMSTGTMYNGDFADAASYLPSDLMSPGLVSPPPPMSHPGRITLPPSDFSGKDPAAAAEQVGGLTTPGMPGFTFQQMPQTPPLHRHFLSPGLGTFSPGDGTASFQSGSINGRNTFSGFTNVAPGAPFQTSSMQGNSFSSMFSSAEQPATPHWSQPSGPRRGSIQPSFDDDQEDDDLHAHDISIDSGVGRADIAKTPGAGPRSRPPALIMSDVDDGDTGLGPRPLARRASDTTPGPSGPEEGYPFPLVVPSNSSHLARRASTNLPAGSSTTSAPSQDQNESGRDTLSLDSIASTDTEQLTQTIARLSVRGAALAKGSETRRSISGGLSPGFAELRERNASVLLQSSQDLTPTEDDASRASDGNGLLSSSALGAPFSADRRVVSDTTSKSRLRLDLPALSKPTHANFPNNGST